MKLNERLLACIAGYQFRTNRGSFLIGEHNAEQLVLWLTQCEFDIIDEKVDANCYIKD